MLEGQADLRSTLLVALAFLDLRSHVPPRTLRFLQDRSVCVCVCVCEGVSVSERDSG